MSMDKSKKRLGPTATAITLCESKKQRKVETTTSTTQQPKTYFPSLPYELILYDILTRLPIKSLHRFSSVNKLWRDKITGEDAVFNASHLIHSKQRDPLILFFLHEEEEEVDDQQKKKHKLSRCSGFNFIDIDPGLFNACNYFRYPSIKLGRSFIVGECNGLFCIGSRSGFEILNLSTHEVLLLPRPPPVGRIRPRRINYGFGFDSTNNVYKIVQIVDGKRCMVFTLGGTGTGANSWRDITHTLSADVIHYLDLFSHDKTGYVSYRALYSTGDLYWHFLLEQKLFSFNVQTEEFLVIPTPYLYISRSSQFLLEFNGCPCVGYQTFWLHDRCTEIKLFMLVKLKKPNHYVWEQIEILEIPLRFDVNVRFTSFGDKLIAYWFDDCLPTVLCIYEFIHEKRAFVNVPLHRGFLLRDIGFIYHVENLQPLKTLLQSGGSSSNVRYIHMPKQSAKKPPQRYF